MLFRRISLLCLTCLTISGCTKIPDADIRFLDRAIPVGITVEAALERLARRGFSETQVIATPRMVYNPERASFEEGAPLTLTDKAQQTLATRAIEGRPEGALSCFARGYHFILAAGDRIICLTTDRTGRVSWRQAGFRGASL